jgi:NADPH:quinone reductase-like Zn-dependent oxidoreductase
MRAGVDASFTLMREGKLKMVVGKTYPLEQAPDALRFLASRGSTGKLVLQA